jgi:hypothetical protein
MKPSNVDELKNAIKEENCHTRQHGERRNENLT